MCSKLHTFIVILMKCPFCARTNFIGKNGFYERTNYTNKNSLKYLQIITYFFRDLFKFILLIICFIAH